MTAPLGGDDPIGGGAARTAARDELSRPEYRHRGPGLLDRITTWIGHLFDRLLGGSGGSHVALAIVVALLVVAIVLVARSARVPARRGRGAGSSDVSDPLAGTDAREHRRLAARWEAEGRHAEALREWLRAAVATIEERGILPVRPGRTGARTAAEAGPVLPGAAPDLATATAAFDQVWFGGRRATDADVAAAHRAADAVRTERVRVEAGAGPPDGIAAPW